MMLAALGVVFGDIGTSPLYAFKAGATHEIFLACSVPTYDDALSQWWGSEACRSRTWGSISARLRIRAAPARSSIA